MSTSVDAHMRESDALMWSPGLRATIVLVVLLDGSPRRRLWPSSGTAQPGRAAVPAAGGRGEAPHHHPMFVVDPHFDVNWHLRRFAAAVGVHRHRRHGGRPVCPGREGASHAGRWPRRRAVAFASRGRRSGLRASGHHAAGATPSESAERIGFRGLRLRRSPDGGGHSVRRREADPDGIQRGAGPRRYDEGRHRHCESHFRRTAAPATVDVAGVRRAPGSTGGTW